MSAPGSLSRRLARLVMLGFAAVWMLALIATGFVLNAEQQELTDKIIQQTALVFLPASVNDYRQRVAAGAGIPVEISVSPHLHPEGGFEEGDGALVYRLLDPAGAVVLQSARPPGTVFPATPERGFSESASHVFYTTPPDPQGFVMQVGDLRQERFEAYRDSFLALAVPMLAILPLAYLMVGWIGRSALKPLDRLRDEIARRGDARLDPIDASGQPAELRAITTSLNGFMIRLSQALDGERAFATSAAHELRTPVAIALAQVQRLRAEDAGAGETRLIAIEDALKRMSRLVQRLLQLARAEAGVGLSDRSQDIARLLDVLIDDSRRDPMRAARLKVDLPSGQVRSRVDADAFAMVVGNLIDNAFQHAPGGTPVRVGLTDGGVVRVSNEGPVVPPEILSRLTRRFQRGSVAGNGFGLGLYIADTIARHVGGTLDLQSPAAGRTDGFEVRFAVPLDIPDVSEP